MSHATNTSMHSTNNHIRLLVHKIITQMLQFQNINVQHRINMHNYVITNNDENIINKFLTQHTFLHCQALLDYHLAILGLTDLVIWRSVVLWTILDQNGDLSHELWWINDIKQIYPSVVSDPSFSSAASLSYFIGLRLRPTATGACWSSFKGLTDHSITSRIIQQIKILTDICTEKQITGKNVFIPRPQMTNVKSWTQISFVLISEQLSSVSLSHSPFVQNRF